MAMVWLAGERELDRDVVGGKAWGINKMRALGMPVPPAFVLTTDHCRRFHAEGGQLDAEVREALDQGLALIERATGRAVGDPTRPLLVSVRSGAAQSMPGMMDTVLNLGITPTVQKSLAGQSGSQHYADDTARRFQEQFERVVGSTPPFEPIDQLHAAVAAVFTSWMSPRAKAYRQHHRIADDGGTAVTVQAMAFGNLDDRSGTGVLFSRNPLTGDSAPYGEWLPRGQGEDVVSGRFDALPLSALAEQHPQVHQQLLECARILEQDGRDVQDIEFTVESGRLYLLQTRAAKRSPDAAVRFAVDLAQEGLLTADEALLRVSLDQVVALTRPHVAPAARAGATVLAKGEPACPGVGRGLAVTDCDAAEDATDEGTDVVLVRPTTDPDDVHGMIVSSAVVTEVGGATSHAAVVSRELGRPCVVGCGPGTVEALAGKQVTVDGSTGEIYEGVLELAPVGEEHNPDLATVAAWARDRSGVHGSAVESLAAAQTSIRDSAGVAALATT